jgi:hypothetical protein
MSSANVDAATPVTWQEHTHTHACVSVCVFVCVLLSRQQN